MCSSAQLALRDVQTTGDAIVAPSDINPNQPSTRLVNGLYQPTFTMKSSKHELWRLANIGADVFYQVQFRVTVLVDAAVNPQHGRSSAAPQRRLRPGAEQAHAAPPDPAAQQERIGEHDEPDDRRLPRAARGAAPTRWR